MYAYALTKSAQDIISNGTMVTCVLIFATNVILATLTIAAVTEIKVGVLLMSEAVEPFDMRRIRPALDIAYNFSETYYGIKYKPIILNYTGFCPIQDTIGYFTELFYHHHVQAVIGPACSNTFLSVGRLAQYLGMPIISGVGDLIIRSPSDMHTTFTRMSYNLGKFASKFSVELPWLFMLLSCLLQ